MIEERSSSLPSVVMLTADRRIDRRILLQADSLACAGWDVTIVAPSAEEIEEASGFRARVVRAPQASSQQVIFKLARTGVVRQHLWRLARLVAWRFLFDPRNYYAAMMLETALKFTPDVFVAHDLPMLSVAKSASAIKGSKLVYDSHELFSEQEFTAWERRMWVKIERENIGSCDLVITVNESIAHELETRYNLQDVKVVLNADRLPKSEHQKKNLFREEFHLSQTSKILLFQGGVSPGRNLSTLIAAMSLVSTEELHLVILGDGPSVESLMRQTAQMKLKDTVHFLPSVKQHDLISWTSSADVGIVPYAATCLNNYYCTPNKLFEFIVAGLPIIASDLPEMVRLVETHSLGMVGDTTSPTVLANLIDRMFEKPEALGHIRENVKTASETLNWENESEKLIAFYADLK